MANDLLDYLNTEANQEELDERVTDLKGAEAAKINNQGRAAQIAYLTAGPVDASIELTKADWVEIFYSLESKMEGVLNEEYGNATVSKRKWVKQLKRIMEKIGPDGELAIEKGVAPCRTLQ